MSSCPRGYICPHVQGGMCLEGIQQAHPHCFIYFWLQIPAALLKPTANTVLQSCYIAASNIFLAEYYIYYFSVDFIPMLSYYMYMAVFIICYIPVAGYLVHMPCC